ncbi:MAG: TolC family protein, partial [Alkalispirochaeta sp.]
GTLSLSEEELLRRVTQGSWELRALAEVQQLQRARERIAAGSRPLRPDIGFRMDLSWQGALEDIGESEWRDRGDWQVTLGVGISTTLFDGGRLAADHTRAAEELTQADLERVRRQEAITSSVREHLRRLETLRARLEHSAVELSVRAREVQDAQAAVDAGTGGEDTFLRALIDQAGATATGYNHLAAYRGELWSLTGLLGAEAF